MDGGLPYMMIITLIFAGIIILFLMAAYNLYVAGSPRKTLIRNLVLSVIYLGSFAAVWGIFTQGFGIWSVLKAIQEAADVSFGQIVGGIKYSMIAPLYGVVVFLVSSILWFILKIRYNSVFTG